MLAKEMELRHMSLQIRERIVHHRITGI